MTAPFYKFGLFGDEVSLIVAFVIGLGFGFFLERAGFGSARKLAAQFYFRDLAVLKVMFTAIVTAMVGLYLVSRLGLVDLSLVYLTNTFLVPQIVGGLLLGVGFVIGGYCPGTSVVSAATGRVDGIVYLGGVVAGLFAYGEVYPSIASFAKMTPMGRITLPELLHIPYGVLVLAVVIMAVVAFVAAEWAEKKFGGRASDADSLLAPAKPMAPARKLAGALVVLGAVAAVAGSPYRSSEAKVDTRALALEAGTATDHVAPDELADWLVQGRNDFLVVDVRDEVEFATYHIPGAYNVPLATLSPDFAPPNERIILYSDGSVHSAQAWFLLRSLGFRSVYMLFGGLEAWKDEILFPRLAADATAEQKAAFEKRAATARFFGGQAQMGTGSSAPTRPEITPPTMPASEGAPALPSAPRKRKEGC